MQESEADLIRRCARGEDAAYRELVARLERPLHNFILRYVGDADTAEDVFQETFVRVVRTLGTFRPEASLSTWIFTIARNLCLDHLKAKKRHREVSIDSGASDSRGQVIDYRDVLRSALPQPEGRATHREDERRLLDAVGKLGATKREALSLRIFAGLPYEEIAGIVGSPVGTVKFRVHEAIQELARALGAAAERPERRRAADGA
jgi:RNA polymerase sigma-70 factor, ECF subfamily